MLKSRLFLASAVTIAIGSYVTVAVPISDGASDASSRCQSAKLRAAARHAACLLNAEARAQLSGGVPDTTKCDLKFNAACAKVEAKLGSACPTHGDCDEYRAAAACAADQLPLAPTTTTTTTSTTTTTTSTMPPPPCPTDGSAAPCQTYLFSFPSCVGCCDQSGSACSAPCAAAAQADCADQGMNAQCAAAINAAGCASACDCG